ncbi:MAG: leucine--tRNA ligase [Hydrogenophaga sp.]|uniref:leucine--tRNA ligase n=1 Tax=Hydrogenophaga sp. TaxID=1904254 RepID=UPI001D3A6276|nr:leucine--tRNA ligase [Hydrogenophaga sp.]MBX3608358.1 leucine--tRNA ligase [Hydrogenophaga sp.]
MQDKYAPQDVERSTQSLWTAADAYRVTEDRSKPKFYACSMLPYPSGKLHMGHVRNYTINDMLTRQLRMKGHNVLMPMGWDAFGLPAENAAIKNKVPPAKWTYDNIAYMKRQMQAMGLAIDWSREVATCSPDYYKWNQWLFLKMLEKGIAYRKTQVVNWDPVDQTVLANEQVIDGRGWRTGALVEKREIPGYYLNITAYAGELLDHVQIGNPKATLSGWPDKVRLMQENWIGKSEGLRFAFPHQIKGADGALIGDGQLYVFTTRADTIMGVTFCAVAPEHPLATHAAAGDAKLAAFIEECKTGGTTEAELATQEKKGLPTGLTVTHPITGAAVPVWVGNYVLMGYGDGAVMGVPAHDERDFAFAKKYGLEIKQVVAIEGETFSTDAWAECYGDKQRGVCVNSGFIDGLGYADAVNQVAEALAAKGLGEKKTTWRLRDWGISRQRYWGTPIPIIHCPEHGAVPVPEKDLPVVLPEDCVPDGSGNPLNHHEGFHAGVVCPVCGAKARRETDTMDTFVDSSWYFMRYCDPTNADAMVADGTAYWMRDQKLATGGSGMDQYIGGIEHAILHLLYARFWTKVMRDLGLVTIDEPFTHLLTQGMVLNHIYSRRNEKGGKEYFWPHDVENTFDEGGKITGAKLKHAVGDLPAGTAIDYEGVGTMSKSKNNGVDPQELIEKYGADTARLYTMFTAPPEATLEWNDAAVEGSYRFLRRVWAYGHKLSQAGVSGLQGLDVASVSLSKVAKALRLEIHTVLKQVEYDYQRMQYNTVVSGAMKMLNALESFAPEGEADQAAAAEGFGILLRCLYPATPHITDALWRELGYDAQKAGLLDAPWPQVDEGALQRDEIELVLQINGKLRGSVTVPASADKAAIEAAALASEAFIKQAAGAAPKKVVVVPGRLVNVVV